MAPGLDIRSDAERSSRRPARVPCKESPGVHLDDPAGPTRRRPARGADGDPVSDRGDTVCVIGAGASGLTAVKNLREPGFGVDCYERETGVGGAWNWRHDRSPVYASTHLISSKPFTQFPDFPMPDSWPDYPHHSQVLAYLERYADHFGLREHIWFGTEVTRVEPADGRPVGRHHPRRPAAAAPTAPSATPPWSSPTGTTGRRSCPRYEGLDEFRGEVIHASAVQGRGPAARRRVLVVGAGNTGCDIAVEAAQQAAAVLALHPPRLLVRPEVRLRPPRRPGQRPVLALRLPLRRAAVALHRTLRLHRRRPDPVRPAQARPPGLRDATRSSTASSSTTSATAAITPGAGRRPVRPATRSSSPTAATVEPDLVIFATGYLPRFEFLAPELLDVRRRRAGPRLYLHTFSPAHPTLAVAGLLQPDSGVFSLVALADACRSPRWLRLRDARRTGRPRSGASRDRDGRQRFNRGQGQAVDPALVRGQPRRVPAGAGEDPARAGGSRVQ